METLGVNAWLAALEQMHKASTEDIVNKFAILTDMVKRPGRTNAINGRGGDGFKGEKTVGGAPGRLVGGSNSFTDVVGKPSKSTDIAQKGSAANLKPPNPQLLAGKRDISPKHRWDDEQGNWNTTTQP